mmetsp:Transcript_44152/g.106394  ORF Transcript_44152/g.106394 Transcript_44152/m.106394 type:complete len:211 (-) Transcript_44152:914-1546(-)
MFWSLKSSISVAMQGNQEVAEATVAATEGRVAETVQEWWWHRVVEAIAEAVAPIDDVRHLNLHMWMKTERSKKRRSRLRKKSAPFQQRLSQPLRRPKHLPRCHLGNQLDFQVVSHRRHRVTCLALFHQRRQVTVSSLSTGCHSHCFIESFSLDVSLSTFLVPSTVPSETPSFVPSFVPSEVPSFVPPFMPSEGEFPVDFSELSVGPVWVD